MLTGRPVPVNYASQRDPATDCEVPVNARLPAALLLLLLLPLALPAAAQDGVLSTATYVELKPSFVTNFGYAASGRLRHVRADIELKIADPTIESRVMYHAPLLRNEILFLLTQQDEVTLGTSDGRRQLQADALMAVQKALEKEEGEPLVLGLVFTNFFVQR